jgi:hypothetical protein
MKGSAKHFANVLHRRVGELVNINVDAASSHVFDEKLRERHHDGT